MQTRKKQTENTSDNEYLSLINHLNNGHVALSFSTKDIDRIKKKLELDYLRNFTKPKESLEELIRLKTVLLYHEEQSKKKNNLIVNVILNAVLLGTVVGSLDFFREIFSSQFQMSSIPAHVVSFVLIMLIALIFVFVIKKEIAPEDKNSKNRQVTVYVLDRMIREETEKINRIN